MVKFSNAMCSCPDYLNNQKFNFLTVLCFDHKDKKYGNIWKCKCDCGNIVYVSTRKLKSGQIKSCGCFRKIVSAERNIKDLTGQRFGKLVVLKRNGSSKEQRTLWLCRCDCGCEKTIVGNSLLMHKVMSCGCEKSVGEKIIKSFLDKHHIQYYREYSFPDCRDKKPLRFDFYLPNIGDNGACIEFDGIQHYKESRLYTCAIPLKTRQCRDKKKTEYCLANNILMLRIPYYETQNIESILNDWLFLYDAEDANSSSVAL